jgi:serine/threonine-protein kinase
MSPEPVREPDAVLSPMRWQVVRAAAEGALALEPIARPAFLDEACGGDPELRDSAERLVLACERAAESTGFLAGSAVIFASPVLAAPEGDAARRALAPAASAGENQDPPPSSPLLDALRIALADRYDLEHEIGRGGMATVYLARDERHGRAIALKVVHPHIAALDSIATDGSRFRREIRIAARLTHPHILSLHDSGAAAGLLYYTMPFVDGESLRDRIVRGPMPLPDALRVLRDIARALAHAHRHGVVHRDIKPENILLNRDGDALVADFGVAKALEAAARETDEPHGGSLGTVSLQFGTPTYMAPEQAAQSSATDHRADLYSLGVVAYELFVGVPPFRPRNRIELAQAHQDEQPEPLAALRPDLPPALAALVMGLLAKLPAERPPDADTVVRTLDEAIAMSSQAVQGAVPARLFVKRRRAVRVGAIAVGMLAIVVVGFMITRALGIGPAATMLARGTLSPSDSLLVADFDIRGGADSSLGGVMAELVRTDLRQSSVITVVPASTIRAVLERMQRPAAAPLVSALAREVAQREGIKAVVEGDLTPLRDEFVVTIRLVSAEGDELASFHETADQRGLMRTAGRLTRRLRGKIGESLKSVRASPPLAQVTTPSLTALRKYAEGVRALTYENDHIRAATLFKEALAIDSAFAMAWNLLAATYRNAGMPPAYANGALERAYRFRDRLPERERYGAVGYYFRVGPGRDRVQAAEAYELGLRVDTGQFANNLGLLYQSRREYARAESLYRWYLVRGRHGRVMYENLSNALFFQGKREEAESVEVQTARRFPDADRWERAAYFLYNRGQLDSAQHALERRYAEGKAGQRVGAAFNLSVLHQVRGRLAEAERARGEAEAANLARGVRLDSMGRQLRFAFVDIWHRDRPERGLRTLEAALTRTPLASLPLLSPSTEHYYLWGEAYYVQVARLYAQARRPDRARAVLAQFAADLRDTSLTRASAPAVHSVLGEIALAEGRPLVALEEFRRADRLPDGPVHSCAICRDADVGRAFDQAGMADSAIAAFERYLETPQWSRIGMDARYTPRILRRLGELYEAKGDRAKAIEYYERFVALWRSADPELQPRVAQARRRIEALQAGELR